MRKLVLIDGNAILHRAYHALPPLTNKTGVVVNAVYGFFSMFLKIIQDLKPQYLAVCFDKEKPTFRQKLYVGYQAQRPKMADDLVPQVTLLHEVLREAKIAIFEVDGYEADDLIGTLAVQAVARGPVSPSSHPMSSVASSLRALDGTPSSRATPRSDTADLKVIIVTGDRDMLQLVNSHVEVLAPVKGITEMILFDDKLVEEKYGIKPSQFIDYKALVGDSSDNYPGVTGIGPKTASSLLNEYGSFDEMYKNINSLPPKIGQKLATDAEQASLAKKLATIVTDAPITLKLDECSYDNFDMKGLKEEFEKLGFKSLIKRLENEGTPLRQGFVWQAKEKRANEEKE
ncbi:MAG: 5'-3' exonuclease H3TH domain-containing protein [Patescibacteria group bacterium]